MRSTTRPEIRQPESGPSSHSATIFESTAPPPELVACPGHHSTYSRSFPGAMCRTEAKKSDWLMPNLPHTWDCRANMLSVHRFACRPACTVSFFSSCTSPAPLRLSSWTSRVSRLLLADASWASSSLRSPHSPRSFFASSSFARWTSSAV